MTWILTNDELPPIGQTVLVYIYAKNDHGFEHKEYKIAKFDKSGMWYEYSNGVINSEYVKYWMDIPAVPR